MNIIWAAALMTKSLKCISEKNPTHTDKHTRAHAHKLFDDMIVDSVFVILMNGLLNMVL